MGGLVGSPVEMPKQTGGATAYWVAEGNSFTASDLVLAQLTMTPKQVAALVKLSNRLIKLSNPSAEALVRQDISIALANAIDIAALRGTGGTQPTGIAQTASIGTVALGAAGDFATFDSLLDMEGSLEDANALRGNLGYIMHPKIKRRLKKSKVAQYSGDTMGQYIILPMSDTNMRDVLGYDFKTTTQIPTNLTKTSGTNLSEIYFGNWRELLIGNWGGLEIATSNVAGDNNGGAFSSNQTWIRAIQEVDIAVRHPQSFCLINDAKTV
jgi:HK97 family phage major capsid protein